MNWKDTVVKFFGLKSHSLTFKGNLYDFAYISHKKSVGVITEILGDNIYTIAFFPSMKNEETFISTINFDRAADFIIPRYESLLKFANYIVQKEIRLEKTIDIRGSGMTSSEKHVLHEKLAELYRANGDEMSEYDMILLFICQWLGIKDVFNK
ncbi:MAG: hypothetical protein GY765_41450 [bacterium]|nr:hypothetical protein [bacterium]